MNTNLTIRTEDTLQGTKFVDLATIYNEFATELDIKPIKKFRDKPAAIKRVLDIQAKYSEVLPEQSKPVAKGSTHKSTRKPHAKADSFAISCNGSRTVYELDKTIITVARRTEKEGTVQAAYQEAIGDGITISELLEVFPKIMDTTSVSGKLVDRKFIIGRMKRIVAKGHLKLEAV